MNFGVCFHSKKTKLKALPNGQGIIQYDLKTLSTSHLSLLFNVRKEEIGKEKGKEKED